MNMQRIAIMDPFGTPRRLGIAETQEAYVQSTPLPAPYDFNPIPMLRFEIMDAEGNPVPGAAVSLYYNIAGLLLIEAPDAHVMTPPLADVGGNVSVTTGDLKNAVAAFHQYGPDRMQHLYAVIKAPGYHEQKIELVDLTVKQRYEVTLQKVEETSPLLPILGVAAVVGATIWLVNRS
jgi:hypothetical protein